jgi:predicted N-acetyltransferase YhbS
MPVRPTIRPMSPADVDPASDAILASGWRERRPWLTFVASHPNCRPVVADLDGEIVGTGVATVNGATGWLGTIWVAPAHRRRGLGLALTEHVMELLRSAGCRSMLLVATPEGRSLYERLGFGVQTTYETFEAHGTLASGGARDEGIRESAGGGATASGEVSDGHDRPGRPADLPSIVALDEQATGETRGHLLERFVTDATSRVAVDGGGAVVGYVARAPWGGGATIAADTEVALRLLAWRRATHPPEARVRAGIPSEHGAGIARLEALGWERGYGMTRMLLGEPPPWRPELIWGQFNGALG